MMMWFPPSLSQANNSNNANASGEVAVPTPFSRDPVVGVKDDTLGVFPAGLAYAPFPLVPSLPTVSLGTQIGSLPKQRGWRKGGNLLEVLNQSFSQFSGVGEQPISTKMMPNSLLNITHFSEGFYKGTLPDVLFVWGSDFAVAQALVDEIRFC